MKRIFIFILIVVLGLVLYLFYVNDSAFDKEEREKEQIEAVGVELIAEGFTSPVGFVSANDGTGRMFLIDQIGEIKVIDEEGEVLGDTFLNLSERMVELRDGFDERGLLGLAFHPEFEDNGRFFVHYSAPLREEGPEEWDHTAVISEFTVSEENPNVANIDSERVIIEIDQPQFNHNGGHLAFGPDGYLYIPLGDGGGGNDVGLGHPDIGNGQDTTTLLGSILRIDINEGDPYSIPEDNPFIDDQEGLDEIFAYGLRNPYHISFDKEGDNDLFVADVGQDLWEEVNIVEKGGNYGWNIREGMHCFDPENPTDSPEECPTTGARGEELIDPILEYRNARHDGIGIAIVGGYVYRGELIEGMVGQYVFADWSREFNAGDGSLFVAKQENNEWVFDELTILNNNNDGRLNLFIKGVGEDASGELYLLTTEETGPAGNTGKVFKIVPAEDVIIEEEVDEIDRTEEIEEDIEEDIEEVSVSISNFSYNPETLTVSVGTEVVWTNEDSEIHTVTSQNNFDSGSIRQGEEFRYTFDQPGTFEYFCTPHPFMEGTVVVE